MVTLLIVKNYLWKIAKSNDVYDENWAQMVSPTGRKVTREQKLEKQGYWQSKEDVKPDVSGAVYSRQ